MRGLWINADDFGMTPAVSEGIVEAMTRGVVATTTAMVCRQGAEKSVARLAPRLAGRIGLHLQLTGGTPRSDPASVPSLVDERGRFPRGPSALGALEPREIAVEWRAQLAALRALGVEPSHLDSHHHVQAAPGAFAVYAELAAELGVPARATTPEQVSELRRRGVRCADAFCVDFFGQGLDVEGLLACAERTAAACPEGGTFELMSHPGRVDDVLRDQSSYVDERELELETLCSPELPARLEDSGFALVGLEALD